MWRWDWWTGSSRTEEHSFWTIPSHAGTIEQLYTSSPGDKAVRQTTINYPKSNVTHSNEKVTFCYITFYYFRYMAKLEDTLNLPLFGLFLTSFSLICFDAFSAVTVQYSHNHSRQGGNECHRSDSFVNWESGAKTFTCLLWGGKHSALLALKNYIREFWRNITIRFVFRQVETKLEHKSLTAALTGKSHIPLHLSERATSFKPFPLLGLTI